VSPGEPYGVFLRDCRASVCFMTVAQLRYGAINAGWGSKRVDAMEQALKNYALLSPDDATVWEFARLAVELRRQGREQTNRDDCWIAATTRRHGLRLVTHNARHFQSIAGLSIVTFQGP